jgi:hypothetical protein
VYKSYPSFFVEANERKSIVGKKKQTPSLATQLGGRTGTYYPHSRVYCKKMSLTIIYDLALNLTNVPWLQKSPLMFSIHNICFKKRCN